MKLFKPQEDGSYLVTIKNFLRFDLAIQHISVGLSFQQTSKVIEQHRSTTKNAKLNGLNNHMVSQFVHILLVISLQIISDVLTDPMVWVFSLAVDASTHLGVPLLDQRICVCVKGVLYNLHLVLVPFFERHTAQNYVKLIKILLNTVSRSWREKVISINSNGENTMTSQHASVVTSLENECSNPVLRIWCIPHQLDIIVRMPHMGCWTRRSTRLPTRSLCISMLSKSSSPKWVPNARRTRHGGSHSAIFYAGF